MRAPVFRSARAGRAMATNDFVGVDWGRESVARLRTRGWPALLTAVLVAALTLVALRMELIRMEYSLAAAIAQEETLLGEARQFTVTMRQLRDPGLLAKRARALGFAAPESVVQLPVPGPTTNLADAGGARP